MKKLFSMLMLGLVLVLFLFSGCSKKAENLLSPENKSLQISGIKRDHIIERPVIPAIIKMIDIYEEIYLQNYHLLSTKLYFINFIIASIRKNEIDFIDEKEKISFLNKLESIVISYTQSNNMNNKGIIENLLKIEQQVPKTLDIIDSELVKIMITLTRYLLLYSEEVIIENYLESWNEAKNTYLLNSTEGLIILVIKAVAVVGGAGSAIILVAGAIAYTWACSECSTCYDKASNEKESIECSKSTACKMCY